MLISEKQFYPPCFAYLLTVGTRFSILAKRLNRPSDGVSTQVSSFTRGYMQNVQKCTQGT